MILIPAFVTQVGHRCDAPFMVRLIFGLIGESNVAKLRSIGSHCNNQLQFVHWASVIKREPLVRCI
jgi:hypothetical protein